MKTALRYALLLTLLSIFCLDASAARKRPRKRAKKLSLIHISEPTRP